MNNYNYPFPQNGNNNQNTWQNNGQNWNNIQDNGMYGLPRQPMNYQQMRSMMNQQMQLGLRYTLSPIILRNNAITKIA